MRALIVVRLSRVTEASTSVDRQTEICDEFCRLRGWDVVGVLSDTDVSGAVDPFDKKQRPELGGWLAGEQEPDADVLVTYRADRLTRSVRHLQRLVHWAEDNNKLIVSATEPHFDMTSPFAAVILALIGTISEWELNAISERNASTRKRDRRLGKYTGSTPPWGYTPRQDVDGVWRLVPDPEQVPLVQETVRRVLDGEPLFRIAQDFTDRGILTPKDAARRRQGKPVKGTAWSSIVLKRSLLSEAMLGLVISDGQVLRDAQGVPVQRSEPLIDRETFNRVKVAVDARSQVRKIAPQPSLLTQVLFCGVCQEPVYRFNGGSHSQYPRYRCRSVSKGHSCGNTSVAADKTDETVNGLILALVGSAERRVKQWVPGSDHAAELAEITAELLDITGLIGSPGYRAGSPQRLALDARIEGLAARQEQLEAQPSKPAGYEWVPTGERFSDWWDSQDYTNRNLWLRDMSVRVTFGRERFTFEAVDLYSMLAGLDAAGTPAEVIANTLAGLSDSPITGVQIDGETVTFQLRSGETVTRLSAEQEAQAQEFYGWESTEGMSK